MGLILDTSAIVDLERRGQTIRDSAPAEETEVFLPALVLAELWVGVETAPRPEVREGRLRKIEALVSTATVLSFDEEIAPTYARLYAQLKARGTPIPSNDLAIAATAVYFGHEILVGLRDEGRFRKVPGLSVIVLGRGPSDRGSPPRGETPAAGGQIVPRKVRRRKRRAKSKK